MKDRLDQAIAYIRNKYRGQPRMGLILGSGLGDFADQLHEKIEMAAREIPHYPISTVQGHQGALVFGRLQKIPVIAVKGRTHFYEGYSMEEVTFSVRLMQALGIRLLLVTNAAGSVNPLLRPGDLMLIHDHVNFQFQNPLRGPLTFGGERFPDMTKPYFSDAFPMIERIALERNIALKQGILWANTGPTYETRAEVRMIRRFGAHAVSMSTVPEVIVAVQSGLRVIGISCITNFATGITNKRLSHDEVTDTAAKVKTEFQRLVAGIIEAFPLLQIT